MIKRPNWGTVYRDALHIPDRDQELLLVTRETLRLAMSAIEEQQRVNYYSNFAWAWEEIWNVLKYDRSHTE